MKQAISQGKMAHNANMLNHNKLAIRPQKGEQVNNIYKKRRPKSIAKPTATVNRPGLTAPAKTP